MTTATSMAKKKAILEIENLLATGASDNQARQWCREERGMARSTAYRYVALANKNIIRRLQKKRYDLVARQNAKLEAAQREAMAGHKIWVTWDKDGVLHTHKERAPDLSSFNAAVSAQNKLLGLNAPDRKEVVQLHIHAVLRDIVDVARQFIPNPQKRVEFAEALQGRVAQRLRERPEAAEIFEVARASEAAGVIEVARSEAPTAHAGGDAAGAQQGGDTGDVDAGPSNGNGAG